MTVRSSDVQHVLVRLQRKRFVPGLAHNRTESFRHYERLARLVHLNGSKPIAHADFLVIRRERQPFFCRG